MSGARDIPWKRITAEGAAIVASILLAFWIDAAWDNHQDRLEEREALVSIRAELESNLGLIERELKYRHAMIESIETLFAMVDGEVHLSPNELDKRIGDLTWWAVNDFSASALQSIIASGRLSIIEDAELRRVLVGLMTEYETVSRSDSSDEAATREAVLPYLNKNGSLRQLANTMGAGRPGVGSTNVPPIYPVDEPVDHSALLDDEEFLGIVVYEHWNHQEAILAMENLAVSINEAVALVDKNL